MNKFTLEILTIRGMKYWNSFLSRVVEVNNQNHFKVELNQFIKEIAC